MKWSVKLVGYLWNFCSKKATVNSFKKLHTNSLDILKDSDTTRDFLGFISVTGLSAKSHFTCLEVRKLVFLVSAKLNFCVSLPVVQKRSCKGFLATVAKIL